MSVQAMRQTELAIYFFYGLSYVTMGIAITTVLGRPTKLSLIKALPWLAAFGLVHGFHEWIEMVALVPGLESLERTAAFGAAVLGTLSISAFFLFQFGIELCREELGKAKSWRLIPLIFLLSWIVLTAISGIEIYPFYAFLFGHVTARYFIYFPANVASGAGVYLLYRSLYHGNYKRVAIWFLLAALFFWANAVFAGLIAPNAPFWPASVVNSEAFLGLFGIPVIVFRAICAIGITVFVMLGVRVFDIEESALRERRKREFEVLDKLSGMVARSVTPSTAMPEILKVILEESPLALAAGAIFLRRPDTDELWLEAAINLSSRYVTEKSTQPILVGREQLGLVAKSGEATYGRLENHPDVAIAVSDPGEYGAFAIAPFVSKGRCFGALLAMTPKGIEFADEDKKFMEAMGGQLGMTLENALLEEQRRIASILQQSLLGPVPVIEGMDIGVRYEPATVRMIVGGDFYDFFELPDGALGVVVGDVSGKGLIAASLTSSAKNTIRAFLYESPSPARALLRTNKVLTKVVSPGQFVTALALVLRRDFSFTYSGAGHPRPLLCNAACRHMKMGFGLPIGAFKDADYIDAEGKIELKGYLLLYTDGLIDAKRDGKIFGEEGLETVIAERKGASSSELSEAATRAAKEFGGGKLHDDVAVVVLRRIAEEFSIKFIS